MKKFLVFAFFVLVVLVGVPFFWGFFTEFFAETSHEGVCFGYAESLKDQNVSVAWFEESDLCIVGDESDPFLVSILCPDMPTIRTYHNIPNFEIEWETEECVIIYGGE